MDGQADPVHDTASGQNGLAHNFPNVSRRTERHAVLRRLATTPASTSPSPRDHGNTWTCSGADQHRRRRRSSRGSWRPAPVRTSSTTAPSVAAPARPWYVYFAQNTTSGRCPGWTTKQLMSVHRGQVCEGGVSCTGGRQLFDDFAVDTDRAGWAHIAYSHDAPEPRRLRQLHRLRGPAVGYPGGRPQLALIEMQTRRPRSARLHLHQLRAGRRIRGGDEETRTPNPRLAKAVLCQLSYVPERWAGGQREESEVASRHSAASASALRRLSTATATTPAEGRRPARSACASSPPPGAAVTPRGLDPNGGPGRT